jgi:hypothetical protein
MVSISTRVSSIDSATPALAEAECLFNEQLSPLRLHPGAAIAVYHRGQLVLDLAAGFADAQRG